MKFNYAEEVNKRSQDEIETEVLQFFTQDPKQENKRVLKQEPRRRESNSPSKFSENSK